jgi:hypothetical protein
MEDSQIIEELDPESTKARRYLYHFVMALASTAVCAKLRIGKSA